jgi:hypothetical protein
MNPIDPKFNSLTQLNKCSVFFNQAGYILQLLLLRTMDWCHGRRFYNLINFIKWKKKHPGLKEIYAGICAFFTTR